jgi:hypothetical protein
VEPFAGIDVTFKGHHDQGKIIFRTEVDANPLAGLVSERANVNICLQFIASDQFRGQVAEFGRAQRELDANDAGVMTKAFVVFERAEEEEFLLFFSPVTSDSLEDSGTVVEGVGKNAHFGILDLAKASLEINDQVGING